MKSIVLSVALLSTLACVVGFILAIIERHVGHVAAEIGWTGYSLGFFMPSYAAWIVYLNLIEEE